MTQHDGQKRARDAVALRMTEAGISQRAMAVDAGISTNTVGRFLNGTSWPRGHQIRGMERALGWPEGSIEGIANGGEVPAIGQTDGSLQRSAANNHSAPTLGGSQEAQGVVVALGPWADELTPLERQAYEAKVQAYALQLAVEWEEKSRARRDEPAQQ